LANEQIMSVRTIVLFVAIGMLSFFGALYFDVIESDAEFSHPAGSNSFSVAATGHMAFVETLRQMDISVSISRYQSSGKAGPQDSLAVIEPFISSEYKTIVSNLLSGDNVLLVLPKWTAKPDPTNRQWVVDAKTYTVKILSEFISLYIPDAAVFRPFAVGALKVGNVSYEPSIDRPQLLKSNRVEPIIETKGGILFGRYQHQTGKWLYVLSDPDILANHGLGKADNAALAISLIAQTIGDGGRVYVDETAHGFQLVPNLWKLLLSKPYIVATIIGLSVILLILWAALQRFGKALPARDELPPGKEILIENTAALLGLGGHGQDVLENYLDHAKRDVARALHAPTNIIEKQRIEWLDRIAANRNIDLRLENLTNQVDKAQKSGGRNKATQYRIASMIHKWKMEMIHGSGHNSRI
jgi:hypothetical protein